MLEAGVVAVVILGHHQLEGARGVAGEGGHRGVEGGGRGVNLPREGSDGH